MGLQTKKDTLIIGAADKSKFIYAILIADSLIKSKDSHKISDDFARIWIVCGYALKEKLDKLFKQCNVMTLNEYCKKFNPSSNCLLYHNIINRLNLW